MNTKSSSHKRNTSVRSRKKTTPARHAKTPKVEETTAAASVSGASQVDVTDVSPSGGDVATSGPPGRQRTTRTRARRKGRKDSASNRRSRTPAVTPGADAVTTSNAERRSDDVQPPARQKNGRTAADVREERAPESMTAVATASPQRKAAARTETGDTKTPRRKPRRRTRRADTKDQAEVDAKKKPPARKDTRRKAPTRRTEPAEKAQEHTSEKERDAREMLINVSAGDECRIAVMHEGRLEELFIEREASQSHVGNIYKGRITNVEAAIQAVFVDFGLPKNGFLHVSDVQPQYFPNHNGEAEDVGRKIPRHNRPPIQKCFRRGQEVIVQITKEGVGTKGPTLTTYLSIPGRYLVMMPGMSKHGVSRRIEDDADRRQMRDMLGELDLPSGMGFIMRTAGLGRSKRDLQRDLQYLLRLWKTVVERTKRLPTPAELYQESDLVTRTIRDIFTSDFTRIIVDDAETAKKAREFLQIAMPRSKTLVELYSEREPLFHRFHLEQEIEGINMRHVPLPSGGSIVIDSTEALVAIDVNSGRFRTTEDAEETALKVNLDAAEEIARQLRLRDLGGLIVCDFIDLRLERNKREVEHALREALKKHKERAQILKMSRYGIIEMTRQRQGPSFKRNIYFDCPHCKGSGLVKMPDSLVLDVMRIIQLAAHNEEVQKVSVTVASDIAFQILNNKRAVITEIEQETGKQIIVRGSPNLTSDQVDYLCEDNRGREVIITPPDADQAHSRRS